MQSSLLLQSQERCKWWGHCRCKCSIVQLPRKWAAVFTPTLQFSNGIVKRHDVWGKHAQLPRKYPAVLHTPITIPKKHCKRQAA